METIKEKTVETLGNSSIHAIPNIIRTNSLIIKAMWTVFFILSTGLSCYSVVQNILDYLNYDVITKIRNFNDFPCEFPKITICNANMLTTNFSMSLSNKVLADNSITDIYSSSLLKSKFPDDIYQQIEYARYLVQSYATSSKLSDEEKKKLGYKIEDILISCNFAGNSCWPDEFDWYFDFNYGNCFVFNSGKNQSGHTAEKKFITRTGKLDGFVLELYVGVPDYIQTLDSSIGAVVFIGNDSIALSSMDSIDVPAGKETNLVIDRLFVKQLNKPYSDCEIVGDDSRIKSDFIQLILSQNRSYSQHDCYDLCYQKKVIENCDCFDLAFDSLNDFTKPCLNESDINCLYEAFNEFNQGSIHENCDRFCPVECEYLTYSFSYSQSDFPSLAYSKVLSSHPKVTEKLGNQTITIKALKRAVLKLNIYYDKLKYMVFDEYPASDIISVLSNIGGTIGLFLGVSLLSFIELVEILIGVLIAVYEKKEVRIDEHRVINVNKNLFKAFVHKVKPRKIEVYQ